MSSKKKDGIKSETALKRKEHVERVLNKTRKEAEEKKRLAAENFICIPQFRNNLPRVPCGPYFRTLELPHSVEDFGVYTPGSSLERSYVWQPHTGPDAGLRVDLVDQDHILVQHQKNVKSNAADKAFLSERKVVDRVCDEKLSWLRDTIYTNNDLYSNTNKFKGNEDMERGHEALTKKLIGENANPFSCSFIDLSFDAASTKTVAALERTKKKDGNESRGSVEWVMPVLPVGDDMWGQILSMVQFETDALDILEDSNDGSDNQSRKRRRMLNTIVTNIRVNDDDTKGKDETIQTFQVSLTGKDNSSVKNNDDDVEEYSWKRDLKMNIKNKSLKDNFVFVVNDDTGICEFCPIRSKIDIRKSSKGGVTPHGVSVRRRRPLESEMVESARLTSELK